MFLRTPSARHALYTAGALALTAIIAYASLVELGWRHQFSPQLRMFADANVIKKNGGSINGRIYGGAVGLEWYVTPMAGVVAEYSASKISLRRERDDTAVYVRLNGPAADVKVRF